MTNTIADDVYALFRETFGYSTSVISPETRLEEDLGLDSLHWLELRVWLAEHGVLESDIQSSRLLTIADVQQLLDGASSGLSAPPVTLADSGPQQPRPAALGNDLFEFRVVTPQAVPFLYELATSPGVGFRWRYRGAIPSPEAFQAALWQGVFAQFVVVSRMNSRPIGMVQIYNADQGRGVAYLGAVFIEETTGTGLPVEAVDLFVRYVFQVWSFRKIYMEVPSYNFDSIRSGVGRRFDIEGCLKEYYYYDGRYWDEYILAISRKHLSNVSATRDRRACHDDVAAYGFLGTAVGR